MDSSIAAIFPPLAQRSGEVSAAGRDTFLASVADSTIDKLLQNVTLQKVSRSSITAFLAPLRESTTRKMDMPLLGRQSVLLSSNFRKRF